MKELIKITEQNGSQVVSARELHSFLESNQQFSDWIQNRIEKYGFTENQDYEVIHNSMKNPKGGRPLIEYALTIDTAKEIAMVEGNNKGKQARQYFIACEKRLKSAQIDFSNPNTVLQLAQNWAESEKKRLEAERQVELLQPKAEFMDRVLDADEKIDIGQASKILELPFGRNTLFQKLREKGVFFKNRNEPKQEYIQRGYFQLKEKFIERNNHDGFVVVKVLVTQKGLEYISNIFNAVDTNKQMALLR